VAPTIAAIALLARFLIEISDVEEVVRPSAMLPETATPQLEDSPILFMSRSSVRGEPTGAEVGGPD